MAQSVKGKAAVRLPDKGRWRRRAKLAAVAKAAKAEEGRVLVQAAAEAEAVASVKVAQELKTNATRPARHGFEGAARRS